MKKLLNVLYVTQDDVYLRQEGETVVAERNKSVVLRLPIHSLTGIVTFGNAMVSPYLMNLCAANKVCVSMLSKSGRFLARVEGPVSGNVHLRLAQMRAYQNPVHKTGIARSFLIGKVFNARSVMMRCLRDHGPSETLTSAVSVQAKALDQIRSDDVAGVDRLRGVEGVAAAGYFSAFNEMLVAQREAFSMTARNRRPPTDPMNAILSYAYTLLAHECRGALEGVGLDPQIGFLHEIRSGRPALALDLMEEFRALVADRVALSLVNMKQVTSRDFKRTESGAVEMSETARKTLLAVWQKKKQEEVLHPFLGEKIAIGLLPHAQALLLARHLRGDLDAYPPYLAK